MSDPVTRLADVPAKWLGDQGKFEVQMKRCKAALQLFERYVKSTATAIAALEAQPSETLTELAENRFSECEIAYQALYDAYTCARYIANDDATAVAAVDAASQVIAQAFDPLEDSWLKAPIVKPRPLQDNGASPTTKTIDNTLKPDVLTLEFQPCEFRKWKDSMEEFFIANGLMKRDPRVQNGFVKICLNAEILELISASITEVDAFGTGGIVQLVSATYNQKHTDTSKKLALFLCKPKPGEKPVSFVARLKQMFQEADLSKMSTDEYQRFFLIAGISNSSLRNKLLEVVDPTFDKLVEKINTWTATQETSKAIEASQQDAAKVKSVNSANRGRGRGAPGRGAGRGQVPTAKPPAAIKVTPETLAGRCSTCGSTAHFKAQCPKSDVMCSTCKKKGHFSNVCMAEYNAWKEAALKAEVKKVQEDDEQYEDCLSSEENQ